MKKGITVIIPWHLNLENLNRAIESIFAQSVSAEEVIIVCNGDGIRHINEIREKYIGQRVRVIESIEANANIARNIGIDACETDYCSFLDCDDEYTSDRIESDIKRIENGEFGISACAGIRQRESGYTWIFPKREKRPNEKISEYIMSAGNFLLTSGFTMPTQIAKDVRFEPQLKKFQDFDFLIRADAQGVKIYTSMSVGYVYHDETVGHRLSTAKQYNEHISWINKNTLLERKAKNAALARVVAQHDLPNNLFRNIFWITRGYIYGGIPILDSLLMFSRCLIPIKLKRHALDLYFYYFKK